MKKVFKMENLDCGNCALKIEDEVRKIDGINNVAVNFMTLKMAVDLDENKLDTVVDKIKHACNKIERGCTIIA